MNKAMIDKAVEKTKDCVTRYWHQEKEFADDLFTDEMSWIGKTSEDFCMGKEEVLNSQLFSCNFSSACRAVKQEFRCNCSDQKSCVIVGRYYVAVKVGQREILSEQIRCTFAWKEEDGELRLCHMHVSSPSPLADFLGGGLGVFHKVGRDTYRYYNEFLKNGKDDSNILAIKDTAGNIRFINLTKIEVAEASRHNTVVFTLQDEVELRMPWKDFLEKLDESFMRVHRSYVVKKKYIKSIDKKVIEMVSGRKIPYVKKYLSVF
ncbi:MAG: LytTR family transcriptional regulator [Clostridiales bacterium]|nr:LytTR family transcriptional regulator [Clostridiales bacterium]